MITRFYEYLDSASQRWVTSVAILPSVGWWILDMKLACAHFVENGNYENN